MVETTSLITQQEHIIEYRVNYSKNHLFWLQFLENKINLTPKLLHIIDDRVFAFYSSQNFTLAKRRWNSYLFQRKYRPGYHIRIMEYFQNIHSLMLSWFANVKNLDVRVELINNCYDITMKPSKNLRQFVIGKNGREIELLSQFLYECTGGNYNFHILVQ